MADQIEKLYTEAYRRKHLCLLSVAGSFGRPASYEGFLLMAEACLRHDCWESLPMILAETLVIGGGQDQLLGGQASRNIADRIRGSRIKIYPEYGHALYEEAKDLMRLCWTF